MAGAAAGTAGASPLRGGSGADRLHPDDRAVRPEGPRALRDVRRGRRLRLRRDERPLLPVAGGAGTLRLRLDDARRHRAGDRPDRPDDVRDLPDHALPPGGRGAEGRDRADPVRRPVHPRAGRGREPQRARHRPRLAAGERSPRDARGGGHDHQCALRRRVRQPCRRALPGRLGEAVGPPRPPGTDRDRRVRRPVGPEVRAPQRSPGGGRAEGRPRRRLAAGRAARRPRRSGRCRSAGAPIGTPP